jgi:hypothetical protein
MRLKLSCDQFFDQAELHRLHNECLSVNFNNIGYLHNVVNLIKQNWL